MKRMPTPTMVQSAMTLCSLGNYLNLTPKMSRSMVAALIPSAVRSEGQDREFSKTPQVLSPDCSWLLPLPKNSSVPKPLSCTVSTKFKSSAECVKGDKGKVPGALTEKRSDSSNQSLPPGPWSDIWVFTMTCGVRKGWEQHPPATLFSGPPKKWKQEEKSKGPPSEETMNYGGITESA